MKGSAVVVSVFILGCIAGYAGIIDLGDFGKAGENISMYILYILIFLVGMSMGCNRELGKMLKSVSPKLLLLPAATILGSLLFSAAAALVLSEWRVSDCMAVGSGLGYYSLSSVLISQYMEPSLGARLAAELGTIALLTNIFRELLTISAAPLLNRFFGPFAPIASAGATAMDVCLPVILKTSGTSFLPAAVISGVITDFSVPFLVSFFCSF